MRLRKSKISTKLGLDDINVFYLQILIELMHISMLDRSGGRRNCLGYNGTVRSTMMDVKINVILLAALVGTTIKSLTVGSEFNCWYWIKYGAVYTNWYFDDKRTTFNPGY